MLRSAASVLMGFLRDRSFLVMRNTLSPSCFFAAALCCAALNLSLGSAAGAEADATAMMSETWSRFRSVKTEREEIDVFIVNAPGQAPFSRTDAEAMMRGDRPGTVHKRVVRNVVYAADWKDRVHLLFSLPPEDNGLGILVERHPLGTQDDLWLFMPGYRAVRRVAADSTQRMAGTDLLYEDVRHLTGERPGEFLYRSEGSEQLDGRTCEVIVATPKGDMTTAYSKRKIWLDPQWRFLLKIEYYDKQGRLWKWLHNSEIREVATGVRKAGLTEMRDLQRDRSTLLDITKRDVGLAIPERIFTRDYLVHPD